SQRITDFVQVRRGVERAEADRLRHTYWQRYGATLLGLVRHHGVDPHHFLRTTHDFDIVALVRAERGLAQLFSRLAGRKLLLTNAPRHYAGVVIRQLRLHAHFATHYTIERMRVHGRYRPKPSKSMLRATLARERIDPGRVILVDDSPSNLRAARALGVRTVLVARHFDRSTPRRRLAGRFGLRIRSLHVLARRLPR